ncbi:MAG: molybdenum cofactor guanylyltransferase [Chitinispirillia bacterium]
MKIIVISGAHSKIGKTTLACQIRELIPGSKFIKIGSHSKKEEKDDTIFNINTPFEQIANQYTKVQYLIIESNRILYEITPECTIYLPGTPAKPSGKFAENRADIKRGERISQDTIEKISRKLDLEISIVKKIIWLSGARPVSTTAIILAGGMSSRMKTEKAGLVINGKNTVNHLYHLLSPHFDDIMVSVSLNKIETLNSIRVVEDIEKGYGSPLMGIYSSLKNSRSDKNFVIACDIPQINFTLLFKMLSLSEDYDIVVPSFSSGYYEPLFAVYSSVIITRIEELIALNIKTVREIYSKCNTYIIKEKDKSWYYNLNTPEDYKNYINFNRERFQGSNYG